MTQSRKQEKSKIDNYIENIISSNFDEEEYLIEEYLIKFVSRNDSLYALEKLIIVKLEIPILDYEEALNLINKALSIKLSLNLLLLKFYTQSLMGLDSYIKDLNLYIPKNKNEKFIVNYLKAFYDKNKYIHLLEVPNRESERFPASYKLLIDYYKSYGNSKKVAHYCKLFSEAISVIKDTENRNFYSVQNFINEKILLREMTRESYELTLKLNCEN